jgi:hypothetical protein
MGRSKRSGVATRRISLRPFLGRTRTSWVALISAASALAFIGASDGRPSAPAADCGRRSAIVESAALKKRAQIGSPSRNIRCVASWEPGRGRGLMACILLSEGVAYTFSALGPVKTFTPCDLLTYHFKVIHYGTTWKGGTFRCRSERSGWTCKSLRLRPHRS